MASVQAVRSKARVVFTAHLSAEDRISPGALFREKSEGRWYRMYLRTGPDQAGSWLREARRAGLVWAVNTTRAIELFSLTACTLVQTR